jgi:hypothetical protein
MKEFFESKSEQEKEPTLENLTNACREVLGEEVEELKNCEGMEEALGLCFSLLIENGIDDPEEFLREKGILE